MHPILVAAWVLGVAFLSNVSPFIGASYTLVATLELNLIGPSPSNFLLVVWASAVGATLAKVVIYFGAFGLKGTLGRNKNIQLIGRNSTKGTFYLVLFVTALLPVLPLDDFIYIGAGATGASLGLMSAVTLLAKLIKSAFEIAVELAILKDIRSFFDFHSLEATIALTAAFVAIGIIIYKLDWLKLYYRFRGRQGPPQ